MNVLLDGCRVLTYKEGITISKTKLTGLLDKMSNGTFVGGYLSGIGYGNKFI
jgi:hypothetical protein